MSLNFKLLSSTISMQRVEPSLAMRLAESIVYDERKRNKEKKISPPLFHKDENSVFTHPSKSSNILSPAKAPHASNPPDMHHTVCTVHT